MQIGAPFFAAPLSEIMNLRQWFQNSGSWHPSYPFQRLQHHIFLLITDQSLTLPLSPEFGSVLLLGTTSTHLYALHPLLDLHRPVRFSAYGFYYCRTHLPAPHCNLPAWNQPLGCHSSHQFFQGLQQSTPFCWAWQIFTLEYSRQYLQLGRVILSGPLAQYQIWWPDLCVEGNISKHHPGICYWPSLLRHYSIWLAAIFTGELYSEVSLWHIRDYPSREHQFWSCWAH